uniref:Uncharacterized protein n=1 Tax=Anguilla anguilla TaxID=7936 RepID=A0A0E9QCR9_ANGAN
MHYTVVRGYDAEHS